MGAKGEFKNAPVTGDGVRDYILDDYLGDLPFEIQSQFEFDGLTVTVLRVRSNGEVEEDAYYQKFESDNQYSNLTAVPKGLYDTFYIEISDDEGQINPNNYRAITAQLGAYYQVEQEYAYSDLDGYKAMDVQNGLLKLEVNDAESDFTPGLIRAYIFLENQNGEIDETGYIPVCFIVPNNN